MKLLRFIVFLLAFSGEVLAQTSATAEESFTNRDAVFKLQRRLVNFTTDAYKSQALKLLAEDASFLAQQLNLPEELPIQPSKLSEVHIWPPFYSDNDGYFGTFATANYKYTANQDNKLCHVQWHVSDYQSYLNYIKVQFGQPYDKLAQSQQEALELATNWLRKAGADLAALNQVCTVQFHHTEAGDKFAPVFWVRWRQPAIASVDYSGDDGYQTLAAVWVSVPEKKLMELDVDARYMNRRRLELSNRDDLLQQTDDPMMRQVFFTTESYKAAALNILIGQANKLGHDLSLAEQFPITSNSLTEKIVAVPYASDHLGWFGIIATSNYIYGANVGNKLCSIHKNLSAKEHDHLLYQFTTNRVSDWSLIDTNAVVALARKWVQKMSVDIAKLDANCNVGVASQRGKWNTTPAYDVLWSERPQAKVSSTGRGGFGRPVVEVELMVPNNVLISIDVIEPTYSKEPCLEVKGREALLATGKPK